MNAVESLLRAHIRDARQAIATAVARVDALEELTAKLDHYEPPRPGRRVNGPDGWTAEEDGILVDHYASTGAAGLHRTLLPHRTITALRSRAHKLGLTTMPSAQRLWCDQCQYKVTRGQIATCHSKFCKGKEIVAAEGGH